MSIAKESWQRGVEQERERNKKLLAEKDSMLAEKDVSFYSQKPSRAQTTTHDLHTSNIF